MTDVMDYRMPGSRGKKKRQCPFFLFCFVFLFLLKNTFSPSPGVLTTAPPARSTSDLRFSSRIDAASEAAVVRAVQDVNYSTMVIVLNILHRIRTSDLVLRPWHRVNIEEDLDPDALIRRLADPLLSDEAREDVVECALHHLIFSLLHEYYLRGTHFLGVGSETCREYLESLLTQLSTGGKCTSSPLSLLRRGRGFFFFFGFCFPFIYLFFFGYLTSETHGVNGLQTTRTLSRFSDGVP